MKENQSIVCKIKRYSENISLQNSYFLLNFVEEGSRLFQSIFNMLIIFQSKLILFFLLLLGSGHCNLSSPTPVQTPLPLKTTILLYFKNITDIKLSNIYIIN